MLSKSFTKYFSKAVITAIVTIFTLSCSSKIENKINQYTQQGKTIICSTLGTDDRNEYVLYYDAEGIFLDNMETTTKMVAFNHPYKEYAPKVHINKKGAVVQVNIPRYNSDASFVIAPKEFKHFNVEILTDKGVILSSDYEEPKEYFLFLPNSDDVYYVRDIIGYQTRYEIYHKNAESDAEIVTPACDGNRPVFKSNDIITVKLYGDLAHDESEGKNPLKDLLSPEVYNWAYDVATAFEAEVEIINADILNSSVKEIRFVEFGLSCIYSSDEIGATAMWQSVAEKLTNRYNTYLEEIAKQQQEERQKQEQASVQAIINQSVSFMDFLDMYTSNSIKAQRNYPIGSTMIFGLELEGIKATYSSYRLVPDALIKTTINMFTDDISFTELNYPCYVYIQTDFTDCTEYWDGTMSFKFENTILKAWRKGDR